MALNMVGNKITTKWYLSTLPFLTLNTIKPPFSPDSFVNPDAGFYGPKTIFIPPPPL